MECPVDGSALETRPFRSTNIEECLQCRGLWFEEGEFRKAKDETEPDLNWLDFDIWSDQESYMAEWSSRKCPQCGKNMATITYSPTEVAVDCCIDRHGMWLDKGEFEAIIEALKKEILAKDVSGYVLASLEEAKEIITGDEGLISEWKDFRTVTRFLQYRILTENPKVAQFLTAFQSASPR